MTEKRLGAVLGAIALAAGSACAAPQQMGPGVLAAKDVGTPIVVVPSGKPPTCSIQFKQDAVTSYPDKFVIFDVSNYCDQQQTVMVGNFRKSQTPSQTLTDCKLAMDPAETERIFANDSEGARTVTPQGQNNQGEPGVQRIRLRVRPNAELPPGGTLSYYFDVCLNGPISADPRLIIER